MNRDIFREYDIRGQVGTDLNETVVYDLGRAMGSMARRRGVKVMTVGRDCRLTSPAYQEVLIRGLNDTGIDTIDIGLVATPVLYFSIRHLSTDGGVMVTASHNPSHFNGFKICLGPDTIHGEEIQDLRRIVEKGDYENGAGEKRRQSVSEAYIDHLARGIQLKRPVKVAFDGGNGVGGLFLLPVLKRLQCPHEAIFTEPDGNFPNHFPDPTVEENLQDLIGLLQRTGAEVGLSVDGDADRLGVVSDNKRMIWGDELLILFARDILSRHPGAAIIGEVKCSQKLFDDITQKGGRAIMWKAGHSLIKQKMKEEKALLAGEMSGHLFFADRYYGYDDAIYASLRLIEILSRTPQKISELLADVPPSFSTPEIRVDCPDRKKVAVVEKVREHFRKLYPIIDIDGVRVLFADGWGLVRASNTQPVLVLRFEAASKEALDRIKSEMEEVIGKFAARI